MWGVFRRFGKFAQIQELGKFPAEIGKHLTALGNANIYKSYMGQKPVQILDLLYRSSKKKLDLHTIRWENCSEMKVFLKELPPKLNGYSLVNIIVIMKCCSKLMINDEGLWKSLEQAVINKIDELKERQLYDVASAFSHNKYTSLELWKEIQRVIINNFCPEHNMQSHVIASIISQYEKLGLLDQNFLIILEQQIIRTYLHLDGTETSRILQIYLKHKVGSDDFYKFLTKQARLTLNTMDCFSVALALTSYVKLLKGDQVDEFEKHILLLSHHANIQIIGSIFYNYAKHMPVPIKKNTERRRFMQELIELLESNNRIIDKNATTKDLVFTLYGMSVGNFFDKKEIWKKISEKATRLGIKNKEDKFLFEEIERILKENGVESLIQ
ncbi:hypothetical protein SteCoe_34486 [Stentor coeruleus]|uniref:Uncharacterized protein n=1 Tax=Stentor coeruleus TaxID=5963 RepID=A0A1R2AUF1_9CILI|nr:hypothetical protein SteCoe_34486 [Stentor coeruleus]